MSNYEYFRRRSPQDILGLLEIRVPVDVEKIARLIEIQVNRISGIKWDGIVFRNGPIIHVLKERSLERQRFTIAHGIGHLLLHDGEEYREEFLSPSQEEKEANRYAIDLLMPDNLVRN